MGRSILMVLPEGEPALSQAGDLADHHALNVAFTGQLPGICPAKMSAYDLLLVWVETAHRDNLSAIREAARSTLMVLAVTKETLLDAAALVDDFHAVLFVDQPVDRQVAALGALRDGYTLLPEYIDGQFTPDSLRLAALDGLTDRELDTLKILSAGLPNNAIADQLDVSGSAARGLVRSLFKKLSLHNRTEAALFAVRHRDAISNAGVSRARIPNSKAGDG